MLEIDKSLASKWGALGNVNKYAPQHIDILCQQPHCRRSLVNSKLTWNVYGDFAYSSILCAACGHQTRFFVIDPPKSTEPDDIATCRIIIIPPQTVDVTFPEEITSASPAFIQIYQQAAEAEFMKLDTLNGMGYRKALEFLIKDYLIAKLPNKQQAISKAYLSDCIRDYIDDPRIKDCASRVVWLGNDATHYVKKWPEQDLTDLKILMQLTVNWIASDLLTKKYIGSMANGR